MAAALGPGMPGDNCRRTSVTDLFEWYGAIAGVVAALLVSARLGTRVTGWAFVLFVTSSVSLIMWSFLSEDGTGIGWQNGCLLLINLFGVYRYLIRGDGA